MKYFTWSRNEGYRVSSLGDKRFSALYAVLKNGFTIEQIYQTKIKGYPSVKEGKGKPPIDKTYTQCEQEYKALWKIYLDENPDLLNQLEMKARENGNCLEDRFASSAINQARILSQILNEKVGLKQKYKYFYYSEYIDEGHREEDMSSNVFVFGSNKSGVHGAGAAKTALMQYGAIMHQAQGLQGKTPHGSSYAIPTCTYYEKGMKRIPALSIEEIKENVNQFKDFASKHPELYFTVTRIGCGLAGFHDSQIAPLFKDSPLNCEFEERWFAYIED